MKSYIYVVQGIMDFMGIIPSFQQSGISLSYSIGKNFGAKMGISESFQFRDRAHLLPRQLDGGDCCIYFA